MDDCAWGRETGRVLFVREDGEGPVLPEEPDGWPYSDPPYNCFTEFVDGDGEKTYVDFSTGYCLSSEEFWGDNEPF